jgi:hypothetical protein
LSKSASFIERLRSCASARENCDHAMILCQAFAGLVPHKAAGERDYPDYPVVLDERRIKIRRARNRQFHWEATGKENCLVEGSNMDWKEHGVKIVHVGELDMNTPQTSGMTRAAAITHVRTGAEKLWANVSVAASHFRLNQLPGVSLGRTTTP